MKNLRNYQNIQNNKNQSGFTLIEIMLGIAIVIILSVVVYTAYANAQTSSAASTEHQNLATAQATIKTLFTNNNFDKITTATAYRAEAFPKRMNVGNNTIQNQWGGAVTVLPSGANGGNATAAGTPDRYFKITYPAVPKKVCAKLISATANNFGTVLVNGVIVQDLFSATKKELDEAAVAQNCSAAEEVPLVFVSN